MSEITQKKNYNLYYIRYLFVRKRWPNHGPAKWILRIRQDVLSQDLSYRVLRVEKKLSNKLTNFAENG